MIRVLVLIAVTWQAIQGQFYSECRVGLYGTDCSLKCGNCGGNGSCYQTNGICKNGCINKFAGLSCMDKCPDTCGGDGSCAPTTLFCLDGCKTGYSGLLCGTDDSNTTLYKCSNCLQPCGPYGCFSGCVTGFYGLYCNMDCACPIGVPCQQIGGSCVTQRGNSTPTTEPDVTVTTSSTSLVIIWSSAATVLITVLAIGVYLMGCRLYKSRGHQKYPTYEDPVTATGGSPYNRPHEPVSNMNSYLEVEGIAPSLYVDEPDSPHYATIEGPRLHLSIGTENPYLNESESSA